MDLPPTCRLSPDEHSEIHAVIGISEIYAAHHIPDLQDKSFLPHGSITEGLDVQEQCD